MYNFLRDLGIIVSLILGLSSTFQTKKIEKINSIYKLLSYSNNNDNSRYAKQTALLLIEDFLVFKWFKRKKDFILIHNILFIIAFDEEIETSKNKPQILLIQKQNYYENFYLYHDIRYFKLFKERIITIHNIIHTFYNSKRIFKIFNKPNNTNIKNNLFTFYKKQCNYIKKYNEYN